MLKLLGKDLWKQILPSYKILLNLFILELISQESHIPILNDHCSKLKLYIPTFLGFCYCFINSSGPFISYQVFKRSDIFPEPHTILILQSIWLVSFIFYSFKFSNNNLIVSVSLFWHSLSPSFIQSISLSKGSVSELFAISIFSLSPTWFTTFQGQIHSVLLTTLIWTPDLDVSIMVNLIYLVISCLVLWVSFHCPGAF